MGKWVSLIMLGLIWSFPFFLFAEEGFLGENPGMDFYSKIDEGTYTIHHKTVARHLSDTPTLDQFSEGCPGSDTLVGSSTTSESLDAIEGGDYTELSATLVRNKAILSTDRFQALTLCMIQKYRELKQRSKRETNARETISYLGLYMDGDTSNSDYDIISDIDKINMLIFSEKIEYKGTPNQAARSFSDFLARKPIPPLFVPLANGANTNNTLASNAGTPTPTTPTTASLASLLTSSCTESGMTSGPVDMIADDTFLTELAQVLEDGGTPALMGGYSTDTRAPADKNDASLLTSANDFFHEMPCTSIFCIKVNMKSGNQNLLGGGKNISIEGILDEHSVFLYPRSESALRAESMTMNNSEFSIKNLKFVDVIAGLRVFIKEKPQKTRRDAKERTPKSEEEELSDITRCGLAQAGLSSDLAQSRSIGGAGYAFTPWTTTESVRNTTLSLGPQEAGERKNYTDCMDFHMAGSRQTYYDSFSTDLTEIQAYTATMLQQIYRIMSTLSELNNKPIVK